MSSRTMSGCSAAARATAVALSSASPTTCMSCCVWRISRNPSRTSAWSSTSRMVIRSSPSFIDMPRQWYEELDQSALTGNAGYGQPSSCQRCPLPHRGEAGTGEDRGCRVAGRETAAVILYPCVQFVRCDGDSDQHHPRIAVSQRVADRLPQDQEGLIDDGARRPRLVSADPEPHIRGGGNGVDVLDERVLQPPHRVLPQVRGQ